MIVTRTIQWVKNKERAIKLRFAVLVLLIAASMIVSSKAKGNAVCSTWYSMLMGQSYISSTSGQTICYTIVVPANTQRLTITLKALDNYNRYDIYLAQKTSATSLSDSQKLNFFLPIEQSSLTSTFGFDKPKAGTYTIVVAPIASNTSSSKFSILADNFVDKVSENSLGSQSECDNTASNSPCNSVSPNVYPSTVITVRPQSEEMYRITLTCPWEINGFVKGSNVANQVKLTLYNQYGKVVKTSEMGNLSYSVNKVQLLNQKQWVMVVSNPTGEAVAVHILQPKENSYQSPAPSHSNNSAAIATTTKTKTLSFRDGQFPRSEFAGTTDATLVQAEPNRTAGLDVVCYADGDDPPGTQQDLSTLLRWDLQAILPQSKVRSASITVNVVDTTAHSYPLYQVLLPWHEPQTTWFAKSLSTSWVSGGATATADRGNTALGILRAPNPGQTTIALNAEGVAVVQLWVNNSAANYGLIIANTEATDGVDFECSESGSVQNRPMLTVVFTPP